MVPKGWKVVSGDEISIKITKGQSPRWQGFEYQDSGTLFVTSENVRDGSLDITNPKFLPLTFNEKLKGSQLVKGDILINIVGASIGRSCLFDIDVAAANINQAVCLLRVNQGVALNIYIHQYLQSSISINRLLGTQTESARPNLSLGDIRDFEFLLPALPEQRKIAQILSTWDKAITTTERLLTNRQQQKKALMQRLLTGKQRFAGFEGAWNPVYLGQVTDSFSGGTPSRSKPEYYGGNIPWIKSGEVNDRFISNVEESITQFGLDNSSAKIVPSNSVLVAMYGATAGKVAINLIDAAINQAVLAILPKDNIYLYFLFYFLEYQMDKTLRLVQGGQPNLNAGIIKDILINLPCLAEQQKIASVLSAADAEITTIQNQLDNLKLQKKALMQQLLTGKRRVKVDSPEV